MSLINFAKQQQTSTLAPQTSSLSDFAKKLGTPSLQTSTLRKSSLSDFANKANDTEKTLGLLSTTPVISTPTDKKQTTWQWLGKQLMKPVGMVAAETEALGQQLGKLIGMGSSGKALPSDYYVPGEEALKVLTGKREYSFGKLWSNYGAEVGINPNVATSIGFVSDIALDPLNFIGGGLTKLGRTAKKVSSLTKAGKTISSSSKIGKVIAKAGYSVDDLVLAGTKMEQAAKGQRAFLKIAGKPIVKGTSIYKATGKVIPAIRSTKAGTAVAHVFTNKTGIKNLDEMADTYNNLSTYRKQQVLDKAIDIQKSMKGMTPTDLKLVAEAIEKPAVRAGIANKTIAKLADDMDNLFIGMKQSEQKVGILKKELTNYFPHIKAQESLKTRLSAFFSPKKYSHILKSSKGRKIEGTVAEINARFGREFFQSNPAIAYAQRGLASSKAVTAKQFLGEVGEKFFVNAENAPIAFMDSTNPLFKGLKADPEVVRVVDQYMQGIKPDDLKLIIRGFDKVQNWWKGQVLISPSYHVRNMFSNFWNNWLAGVKNPVAYEKARKVQLGKNLDNLLVTTNAGEKFTTGQVLKLAKQRGVIGRGWYGADIARQLVDEVGGTSTRAQKLSRLMPWKQNNYYFKTNRAVGSAIEDNARVAHFIDYLQKGFSADDAAKSVKKFLFDYGDLTATEQNIFKRIMPFYTWTRKNIPLQLEQLAIQPEKFAAIPKVLEAIESGVADPATEKYLSEYISENVPVKIGVDKDGNTQYFLMGNWLPAAQAVDFLSQPLENMIQMATPFVKTPYELWANKSTFFKNTLGESSKIEYYYKQPTTFLNIPMRKKAATLARNIRVLNDINKVVKTPMKDEPENAWTVKLLNVLFGKAATYDIEKSRYFYQRDTDERVRELTAAVKKASRLGQKDHARKLQQELIDFRKERGK